MTATPLMLSGDLYSYDFTIGAGQAYGINAQIQLNEDNKWGMFGGNGNKDGIIGLTDKSPAWEVGTKGYLGTDYNLDTQPDNKDKNDIWAPNIGAGSQVPL